LDVALVGGGGVDSRNFRFGNCVPRDVDHSAFLATDALWMENTLRALPGNDKSTHQLNYSFVRVTVSHHYFRVHAFPALRLKVIHGRGRIAMLTT